MNDSWWGDRGQDWKGQNISYLFYWVITPGDQDLGANYLPQATFTAVRKSLLMTQLASACPYSVPSPVCFPRLTEIRHHRDDLCRFSAFHHVIKFALVTLNNNRTVEPQFVFYTIRKTHWQCAERRQQLIVPPLGNCCHHRLGLFGPFGYLCPRLLVFLQVAKAKISLPS